MIIEFEEPMVSISKSQLDKRIAEENSKVAREIFAEIQKMVNLYWIHSDYGMPDMEAEIAELKNKYMEGKS